MLGTSGWEWNIHRLTIFVVVNIVLFVLKVPARL